MKIRAPRRAKLRRVFAVTNAMGFLLSANPAWAGQLGLQYINKGSSTPSLKNGTIDLSATSSLYTVTKQLAHSGSLSLDVGGVTQTFALGSQLTASEYLAAMQAARGGSQTLQLSSTGLADGGTFYLNSLQGKIGTLIIPTGVTALDTSKNGVVNVGSLLNYGSISTTVDSANLTIRALADITNSGSITSTGTLNLYAGGSITNTAGALMQAQDSLNLLSNNINNAGTMSSVKSDVNIAAFTTGNVNVNNAGGTIQALQGAINVGNPYFGGVSNVNVTGGDLLSKSLNLYASQGNADVDVNNVTGLVNVTAACAHITAATPNLQLGTMDLSGDPTFYNTAGSISLANLSNTNGADLAIAASQDINVTSGTLSTTGKTGTGGDLTLVAGANLTNDGNGLVTIDGASSTGGSINLTGVSGVETGGGDVTMVAYAGSVDGSGSITAPGTITTSATHGGSGSVTMIAGAQSGTAISVGSIDTSATNGTAGDITLAAATPVITGSSDHVGIVNGTLIQGGFGAGTASGGAAILNGTLNAGSGNVNVSAGSVDVEGATSGKTVNLTSTSGDITVGSIGTVTATNDVNLNTASGNLTNSGVIQAANGNININSGNTLNVIGTDGTFSATNGAINFRDPSYSGTASVNVSGGDYLSKNFNFYTGTGSMYADVGRLTGVVAGNACNAEIHAQTTNLIIGAVELSGDPTYSSSGDLTLGPNSGSQLNTSDSIIATAGGSIFASGVTAINATGDITMTAGNSINLPSVSTMTATGNITLTAQSGSILVGDPNSTAVALQANNVSATAAGDISTGSIQAGPQGVINLTSTAGSISVKNLTEAGAGTIHLRADQNITAGNINTTGGNTNANGGITIFGGNNVSLGNITVSASNIVPNVTIISHVNGGSGDFVIGSSGATNGMGTYTGGTTTAVGTPGNFIVENWGTGGINVNSTSAINLNGAGQGDTLVLYAPNGAITLPSGTLSSAGNGGSNGGAIWLAGQTINMNGTTLSVNSTAQSGGNIVLGASAINYGSSLNLQSNGTVSGGTIAIGGPGTVTVQTQINQNNAPTSFFFDTSATGNLTVSGSGALTATANGASFGGTVEVVSQGLTFSGSGVTLATNATSSGWGGFTGILCSTLTTGSGSFSMQSNGAGTGGGGLLFLQTTAANGDITVGTGAGQVQFSATSGASSNGAPGGQINVLAGGSLTCNMSAINLAAQGTNGVGGYALLESGMAGPGTMTLSGTMNLNGSGSGNGGQIQIFNDNGAINLGTSTINTQSGSGFGGLIQMQATGDITGNGATLNASGLSGGGAGGTVSVQSTNGQVNLTGGTISANGTGNWNGGNISLTASTNLTSSGTVTANGTSNGFGGSVMMQAGNSGTLTVSGTVSANGTQHNAGSVTLKGGTVNDTATVSANATTAGNGGSVSIISQGAATIGGPISANGAGSGTGGSVGITYNSASTLNLNSTISANGAGAGSGGSVAITDNNAGAMNVNLSGSIATTSGTGTLGTTTLSGGSSITLNGTASGDLSQTTLNASNSGGVTVNLAKASAVLNVGTLSSSSGNVSVNLSGAGGTVNLKSSSVINAQGAANITTGTLTNAGNITGGTVTIDGGTNATLTVNNTGTISSQGQVTLNDAAGAVSLTGAGTIKANNLTVNAGTDFNGSQTNLFLADGTSPGVLNGTVGGAFNFGTTSGSYAANDIAANGGGITLTSQTGNLAVQSGGVLTATGGNIIINTQSGTIDLGANATIAATNGVVDIAVGAIPSGPASKIPTVTGQGGFTLLDSAQNGKTVFYGTGVSASGNNTLDVVGTSKNNMGMILFSGPGISVDGGVSINSTFTARPHGHQVALQADDEDEGNIVNASYERAFAGALGFAQGIFTLSTNVASIKHSGNARVSFTHDGCINLTRGEVAVAAKKHMMIKAASCQIALAPGAFASISREGKTIKVRDLNDTASNSVTVYFADGHSLSVKPGQEVLLTKDMYNMDLALGDGIERRRPAFRVLNNGEFVMASECHPAEMLLLSDVLSRMGGSKAEDDHRLMENAMKTAAIILNVQSSHGPYAAPSTDHSKDAQLTAFNQ